jgi:uncharacterized phage-associated protein
MSGAFGYPGWGTQPHDEDSVREHLNQVEETVRHDRQADKVAKAHHRRPWWKFWEKRRG